MRILKTILGLVVLAGLCLVPLLMAVAGEFFNAALGDLYPHLPGWTVWIWLAIIVTIVAASLYDLFAHTIPNYRRNRDKRRRTRTFDFD
jgi:sterol desaturase/sphingolipid hydroxylase (fatty acid hydroxylase superfamily)